jgi:hypothetical protein
VIGGRCTAATRAATRLISELSAPPVIGTSIPPRGCWIIVIGSATTAHGSDGA